MKIFYLVFFILLLYSILDVVLYDIKAKGKGEVRFILFYVFVIILILISGLRKVGLGADDENYVNMFQQAKNGILRKELAFGLLSMLFTSIRSIFLVFALLGVGLKSWYIKSNLNYWGLALLFYFTHYYILLDIVQIRAGVAGALGLWSLHYAGKRQLKNFLIIISIGLTFHLSILFFLPIYFIRLKDDRLRLIVIFLLVGLFIKLTFNRAFLSLILPEFIYVRIWEFLVFKGNQLKLLNPLLIMNYTVGLFILLYWNKITIYSKQALFYAKTYLIAIYLMFALNQFPTIQVRLYDLLLIVQIPIFDIFLNMVKPRWLIILAIVLYSFFLLFLNVTYHPIIH